MHSAKGGPLVDVNWDKTHRSASLSYWTTGSPSLSTAHASEASACQSVLPATGPFTKFPVFLSNTAKSVFTHCTYWVLPTAPFVSGGIPVGVKPRPTPTPSKLNPGNRL